MAEAYTILAKSAFLSDRYKEAIKHAQKAFDASPNEDRKQRLATYKYKDASVVTLDELDVDTFVFPPAQKTDKFYTYFYFLSSGYQGKVTEELFQPPKDDIKARLAYGKPEQGVRVRVESYTGRYYSVEFDGDRKKAAKARSL